MTERPQIWIDDGHRYHVEGIDKSMPSCSTIAGHVDKGGGDGLLSWAGELALRYNDKDGFKNDNSLAIGTAMHKEIEDYLTTRTLRQGSTALFLKWYAAMNETVSEWVVWEYMLYHPTDLYGGTVDAIGIQDGVVTIFDWKTRTQRYSDGELFHIDKNGRKVYKDPRRQKDAVQLGGYYSALMQDANIQPKPTKAKIVYLYKDTETIAFDEVNLGQAQAAFKACLGVQNTKGGLYARKPRVL